MDNIQIIQKSFQKKKICFLHVAHFVKTKKIYLAPNVKVDRLFLGVFTIGVWKPKKIKQ